MLLLCNVQVRGWYMLGKLFSLRSARVLEEIIVVYLRSLVFYYLVLRLEMLAEEREKRREQRDKPMIFFVILTRRVALQRRNGRNIPVQL